MNLETFKFLFEYFDLDAFLHQNPPIKLVFLAVILCILCVGAYFACVFIEKKLISYAMGKKILKTAENSQREGKNIDITMFKKVMTDGRWLIYLFILGWGLHQLNIGPFYQQAVEIIFISLCTLVAVKFLTVFIPFDMDIYFRRRGSTLMTSQARSLMPIIKGLIWALGLTFLLDNLGCHVSTIIAGLGIMGVAVGLAGQAILADFFSYIVILFDKPFRMGDFVVLGNGKSGEIIYMGPKTTRLRSLEGNVIICSNSEMTKGVLENQGSVSQREAILEIGVSYDNPMDVVRKIPEMMREVVNSIPLCSYERCCMLKFGSANYLFQLIYHVKSAPEDINGFMHTKSEVNLAIQERLNNEKIPGAYPTEHVIISQLTPQPDHEKPHPISN